MDQASHSGLLEDNRFREISSLKKKDVHHSLQWFLKQDYFSDELLGFAAADIGSIGRLTQDAFAIFTQATEKILRDKKLHLLGIPSFFEECIYYSWSRRETHPFLMGRFDINGTDSSNYSIIEFNADTCSTLPETLYWQPQQVERLKDAKHFNALQDDLQRSLTSLRRTVNKPAPILLGSSFGYEEDVQNVSAMLNVAHLAGYQTLYANLEDVVFADEGIFYQAGEEYTLIDVWYKMIPWDWMFTEEPELARTVSRIITKDQAIVQNPPYTTIWQNKLFLTYITQHFPNACIAQTYTDLGWALTAYAQKPVYGRTGENITLKDEQGKETTSRGDYGNQKMVYQKYVPMLKDRENYYYQLGMFYTTQPSALNLRAQDSRILTDDCEFMSHFIL
jgi:glutathionylspermidine synthase